jgi:hypothetical protein
MAVPFAISIAALMVNVLIAAYVCRISMQRMRWQRRQEALWREIDLCRAGTHPRQAQRCMATEAES